MEKEGLAQDAIGAIKHAGKKGGLWLIFLGLALGAALLIYGSFGAGGEKKSGEGEKNQTAAAESYRVALENRIAAVCSSVNGVGRVAATVTLEGSYETVYAQDITSRSGSVEKEYVFIGSGSSQAPIVIGETMPCVAGVGIVCDGGDDAAVREAVISLISAAFGVPKSKIFVAKMKDG